MEDEEALALAARDPGVEGVGQVADLDHQSQDDQGQHDRSQRGRQDQDQPLGFGSGQRRDLSAFGD